MQRRAFLELSAVGTAISLAASSEALAAEEKTPAESQPGHGFELEELTLSDLRAGIDSGRTTCRRLVELYLDRVQAIDLKGPTLRSVIELNPDALAIADDLDKRPRESRGPLFGIPILVKDNVDTADHMATSAGSLALADHHASEDAFLVARLREAGAILLGKTNLSEWANFRSTRSTSGWSGRGGLTRNPYVLDRNPCGSSSGSGVAVAANVAAAAVGTETDGSVVCPSAMNGIVGIKPTLGLVSRSGIVPIAHSQDTAGAMARTVRDAALLLGVMTGKDPKDPTTLAARTPSAMLDPKRLRGARLGVVRKYLGFHPEVDKVMETAFTAMRAAGAEIIDPVLLPHAGQYDELELEVLLYEFKADLDAYLGKLGAASMVKSLADLIRWNEENRDREMPDFGQELFEKAQAKGPLTEKAYKKALSTCKRFAAAEGIDAALKEHRLDALLAPTNGPAWITDLVNGDHFGGGYSTASAVAGYPHVTVPAGSVRGLPIGLSIFGAAWSEPTLLSIALGFEQETRARRPPRFLPTL